MTEQDVERTAIIVFADDANKAMFAVQEAGVQFKVRGNYDQYTAELASMPLKDDLEPKEGAFALCSLGYLGLIDGFNDGRWYGESMYDHTKTWSSSKPRVLGYMPNKHEKALVVLRDACENEGHKPDEHQTCFICQALSAIDEIVGEKCSNPPV